MQKWMSIKFNRMNKHKDSLDIIKNEGIIEKINQIKEGMKIKVNKSKHGAL